MYKLSFETFEFETRATWVHLEHSTREYSTRRKFELWGGGVGFGMFCRLVGVPMWRVREVLDLVRRAVAEEKIVFLIPE